MRLIIPALAAASFTVVPVLAQDAAVENMTCAEFAALDGEGQEAALAALDAAKGAEPAGVAVTEAPGEEPEAAEALDTMREEADLAPEAVAEGAGETAPGIGEGLVSAVVAACRDEPERLASDALTAAKAE